VPSGTNLKMLQDAHAGNERGRARAEGFARRVAGAVARVAVRLFCDNERRLRAGAMTNARFRPAASAIRAAVAPFSRAARMA
jgi:hypothetical protein